MANIAQLPSGKWRVLIRRAGLPAMSKTFSTEKKAVEWAGATDKQITDGVLQQKLTELSLDARVPTLERALDQYVRNVSVKKKGYRQEENRARQIGASRLGALKLTEITSGILASYRDERIAEGKGGNTVRLELALISVLYSHHLELQDIPGLTVNPMAAVKKPAVPKGRERRLSTDEEERLFKAALEYVNPEMFAIIVFGIETGARLSEILGVLWDNIDFEDGVAHLPDTKNGTTRDLPLSDVALDALTILVPRREAAEEKTGKKDPKVFHYTDDGFRTCWYEVLKRAGIDHKSLHFHDLRHELTSRLFERDGLNVIEAATVTGHKDLRMLMRYTHLKAVDIRKKMNLKKSATPVADGVEERLEKLKSLFDRGLISKDAHGARVNEILAEI